MNKRRFFPGNQHQVLFLKAFQQDSVFPRHVSLSVYITKNIFASDKKVFSKAITANLIIFQNLMELSDIALHFTETENATSSSYHQTKHYRVIGENTENLLECIVLCNLQPI